MEADASYLGRPLLRPSWTPGSRSDHNCVLGLFNRCLLCTLPVFLPAFPISKSEALCTTLTRELNTLASKDKCGPGLDEGEFHTYCLPGVTMSLRIRARTVKAPRSVIGGRTPAMLLNGVSGQTAKQFNPSFADELAILVNVEIHKSDDALFYGRSGSLLPLAAGTPSPLEPWQ
jgi:hypothetical protein